MNTLALIEWEILSSIISNQTYATNKTMYKFSHRWLESTWKSKGYCSIYPHYQWLEDNLDYDHFLICSVSTEIKATRLERLHQLAMPKY